MGGSVGGQPRHRLGQQRCVSSASAFLCPFSWAAEIMREVTESQNRIGWKRPLRSSSPTVNLTLPRPPLHHVPKHLIQTSFKYLQGWRLNHFPGQPLPMLDNPFSEVKFPNIQSKPPLAQLEAISSCPITCYLGEETDPHLSTTSFQGVVESDKVSPQPPFLQAKQPQLPQPLLIRLLLQTLHQLRCPSLDTLQHLNVSLVVRGPKLNTVFEGHDHFPTPAGHTIFDTSQDAIGFLGHLGTLLAHIQVAIDQHTQVLLCLAAFQPLFPKPVALHGVVVAQDLALGLLEPHTIDLGPWIQPVQSLCALKQINIPTPLGVICKLTEGALDLFVQIIDKDTKQNWPQHRALGNTACDQPPTGFNSIHHHSLGPAIQPVLYPAKSPPVQAMSSQFLQENAVGNRPTSLLHSRLLYLLPKRSRAGLLEPAGVGCVWHGAAPGLFSQNPPLQPCCCQQLAVDTQYNFAISKQGKAPANKKTERKIRLTVRQEPEETKMLKSKL
ncbi:LOW QUALITY PROTEIN: hypothetical protein QYF61_003300 [Mycteria americana]|uniref:Uncharacterized protein n=1 Tax=Mycteria americana TaxID=33587 RepID=A0AAN7NEW6_MYCAM|nr:LOW QUALITY PROTEIN: hypothetical protein QYF61_003300 [Mycteria americana]